MDHSRAMVIVEGVAKKGIRSIASGLDHCVALGLDGRVWGWFVYIYIYIIM